MRNSLRSDITFTQNLALGALSYTTAINRKFKLEQAIFRFSVAVSETITITYVSALGTNYNAILRVKTLSSEQNYVYVPDGENNFKDGDALKIECTNANVTGVLYGTLKTSEMLT